MSGFVRDLSLFAFLVFLVIFPLAVAGILLAAAYRARRQVTALKSTPVSNIGMAEDGYRKFAGMAEAIGGHLPKSPLTQSPCIWYLARVEEWRRPTRDSDGNWTKVREEQSTVPFFLRDSTGLCTVAPWGADVTPSDKSQWYGSTMEPADRNPPRLSPTESTQPVWEGNQRFRYYEERIHADSNLTVAGQFTSGRFTSSSFDVDDDYDDEDVEDVEAGDEADANEVLEEKLDALAFETTRARIRKSSDEPFIITAQIEAAHVAVSEMGSQVAMYLALAFAGFATLMLYTRFG